jgi:hypothetical protein
VEVPKAMEVASEGPQYHEGHGALEAAKAVDVAEAVAFLSFLLLSFLAFLIILFFWANLGFFWQI